MIRRTLTLGIALPLTLLLTQGAAHATDQPKASKDNTQNIQIGSPQSGTIHTGNISQTQSGTNSHQSIRIGNTQGKAAPKNKESAQEPPADITVGTITQTQKEDDERGSQTVEITHGAHGDIIQTGSGTKIIKAP
jgi:hypothetical protein